MIKSTISNVTAVKNELRKAMAKLEIDESVLVGLNANTGQHTNSKLSVPTIGAIHEFGTDKIPARPWLVPGVESVTNELNKIIEKELSKDSVDVKAMLNKIGLSAELAVKVYINKLSSPPNSESTRRRKKSANPLIDTGEMRNSVTYELTKEKVEEGI